MLCYMATITILYVYTQTDARRFESTIQLALSSEKYRTHKKNINTKIAWYSKVMVENKTMT